MQSNMAQATALLTWDVACSNLGRQTDHPGGISSRYLSVQVTVPEFGQDCCLTGPFQVIDHRHFTTWDADSLVT